jgi:Cu2+-containing amine oxidase
MRREQTTFVDLYVPNFMMIPSDCSVGRYRDKHGKSQLPGIAMKRLIAIIAALAALTGPLYAQMGKRERVQTPLQIDEQQKKKDAAKAEKEYQATMRKTQAQETAQTVVDPWLNLRGADDAKTKR